MAGQAKSLIQIGPRTGAGPARVATGAACAAGRGNGRGSLCGHRKYRELRRQTLTVAFWAFRFFFAVNQRFELVVARLANVLKDGHSCSLRSRKADRGRQSESATSLLTI